MKSKFEELKSLLTLLDVEYKNLTETEIVIPCPCNRCGKVSMADIPLKPIDEIYEHNQISCVTDEAILHISFNAEYNALDWTIMLGESYDE